MSALQPQDAEAMLEWARTIPGSQGLRLRSHAIQEREKLQVASYVVARSSDIDRWHIHHVDHPQLPTRLSARESLALDRIMAALPSGNTPPPEGISPNSLRNGKTAAIDKIRKIDGCEPLADALHRAVSIDNLGWVHLELRALRLDILTELPD